MADRLRAIPESLRNDGAVCWGDPTNGTALIGWIPLAALVGVWVHAATRRRRNPDLAPLRRGAVTLLVLTGLLAVAVVAAAVFGAVVLRGFYGIFAPLVNETPVPDLSFGVATSLVHHPATVATTALLAAGAGVTVRYGKDEEQGPRPARH